MCACIMGKSLVFLPHSLHSSAEGFLYGIVRETPQTDNVKGLTCFYVLGVKSSLLDDCDRHSKDCKVIGYLTSTNEETPFKSIPLYHQYHKWIYVNRREDSFTINQLSNSRKAQNLTGSESIIIVYDEKVFQRSELLLKDDECSAVCEDHFKVLARLLHAQKFGQDFCLWFVIQRLVWVLLSIASVSLRVLSKVKLLLDYSALGSHLFRFLESVVWSLRCLYSYKQVSLKLGNYFLATAVDVCGGILLLQVLKYFDLSDPLSVHLLNVAKYVVHSLQYLLQWLSGSPAGLKLNGPFSLVMGRFFLYHINLWWVFLTVTQPLLEFTFQVFLVLGRLGLTFQAAILEDLLSLVSFHIYCIYVYAARLFYLQLSGLLALWRLFLGRKWNPLRQRVDSCQYSPDQLFVGTLAFTILLFLLPTTLMYYVVFTTMRVVLLVLASVMKHISFFLRTIPIFSSIHWLLGSHVVCRSVRVTPKAENHCGQLVLFVTPIADSWWNTVKNCVPDTVKYPPSIPFGQLIQKLACGELVYPV